jgi:hypothetical protein
MVDLDHLMPFFAPVALLLYLIPAVSRFKFSERDRRRFQLAGILTVGIGLVMAIMATARWLIG